MYKYFKSDEIENLNPLLVSMLDAARDIAGIPFIITSGFRTPEQNAAAGGVSDSAHLNGLAADIKCNNSKDRFLIIDALIDAGFKRIGIAPDHIHVDIDTVKPLPVIFLEY